MKPKLNVVFPDVYFPGIENIEVESLKVNKQRKKIELLLSKTISEDTLIRLESDIKNTYNFNTVIVRTPEENNINLEDEPQVMYVTKKTYEKSNSDEVLRIKPKIVDVIYGTSIRSGIIPIKEINEETGRCVTVGEVFSVEFKDITSKKTGKSFHLAVFDISDRHDSITCQLFLEADEKGDSAFSLVKEQLKKGKYVAVRGKAQYNDYAREVIISANGICEVEAPPKRFDDSEEKRVELHLHTQMSQMDGVTSAKELISRATEWGHKAIAITDHGVVQSFPDALKASNNNEKIKIIYGMEGYLVDDSKGIIDKNTDKTIDSDYVVFDIETTGLNNETEKITEIGAVKISGGVVTDRWSSFVNPEKPIPENIVKITNITDEMVKDAPKIEDALPDFLEFSKGCVLVAHNAAFDTGFIKSEAKRLGLNYDFLSIDTMTLARCMFPELKNHRLDTLTKHLKVLLEGHHRAVNDAKATADVFLKMLDILKEKGVEKLNDLHTVYDVREAAKRTKSHHIILLAKNLRGIRNLYEMVSASQLKYFYRQPRIPRSLIEEKREGIIVGSACEAGELFSAVVDGASDEKLKEIASFYDYLEIQPLGNNEYMKRSYEMPHINTDEDLMDLNRKIVSLGEKLNKPVCATCDVHFIDPEGAEFRKILMHYKGFSDADFQAPLYFRTTKEMLKEFEYLGEEKAYEVVVTNTNLIADMIEPVRPIPTEKCPPVIDGAKEDIVNDSFKKAEKIYGSPLPQIVKDRLDKELYSITTYGFSVMYKIAQELVRKSLSDGYLVGSRGSVGSSFVAFLSDITEVNSLPPHYVCPNCKHSEFLPVGTGMHGCDMEDKLCPKCNTKYIKDGHDIPFETFLGFKGDKEPDIDLNFSGDYQPTIHKYTETYFGEGYVFRAGTIGTVAEKTAFGYVKKYAEEHGITIRNAEMKRLAEGCVGVKRTTGQHPGGIIVVPFKNDIHEFCPVQHPAEDQNSDIITTHFDYHSIDQNLLKLDELGHDDPTVIKMLYDLTGLDPQTIPLDDKETMSLFTSLDALKVKGDIGSTVGTYGVPEFGTKFVRQMLVDTKPTTFAELVRISGLSHGTDVWLNNAQYYIKEGYTTLKEAICTRDDIMLYLIFKGVEAGHAFKIMESVRKGKGLKPEDEKAMRDANVDEWYIESCKKIKYMFPKAHAVAYVTMAFRIAYYKVHFPKAFYIAYYSVRADDFDATIMAKGIDTAKSALEQILENKKNGTAAPKDDSLIPILEICIEMYQRGIEFSPIDLYESDATNFKETEDGIRPPLSALPGLAENAAQSIVDARKNGEFKTLEDLRKRTTLTKTNIDMLISEGYLDLPETDQISLFD